MFQGKLRVVSLALTWVLAHQSLRHGYTQMLIGADSLEMYPLYCRASAPAILGGKRCERTMLSAAPQRP